MIDTKRPDRSTPWELIQKKPGHLTFQGSHEDLTPTLLDGIAANPLQTSQVHVHSDYQRIPVHMAVSFGEPAVFGIPPGAKGRLCNAGAIVLLTHDWTGQSRRFHRW